jgi:transposase
MVEVAWAASRTKKTFYHARYHRLAARRGKKKAIVAVAHSILKTVYHVLKDSVPYKELGADYLNSRMEQKRQKYLKTELQKMGYQVQLTSLKMPAATGS